jgi:transposase
VVASRPTRVRSKHAFSRPVQRKPDHQEDQTGIWSLMTLRRALRKTDLPHVGAKTIRQVLHESGYSYQRTCTEVAVQATPCASGKVAP